MDHKEKIEFLKKFRENVDKYLFLGYAPTEYSSLDISGVYAKREKKLQSPEFREIRHAIHEMKPLVNEILTDCGVKTTLTAHPSPNSGLVEYYLFDLVTENNTPKLVKKITFLSRIDEAIRVLKTNSFENKKEIKTDQKVKKGSIFISMLMDDEYDELEDIYQTINEVIIENGLFTEKVNNPEPNEKITYKIMELLQKAEFFIADLTYYYPKVYFEAGYAEGIGKTPIYIAQKGAILDLDIHNYPVIFYANLTELKRKLDKKIKEEILKKD